MVPTSSRLSDRNALGRRAKLCPSASAIPGDRPDGDSATTDHSRHNDTQPTTESVDAEEIDADTPQQFFAAVPYTRRYIYGCKRV
jgi:hypothetical protein